jgi:hypothetical protein
MRKKIVVRNFFIFEMEGRGYYVDHDEATWKPLFSKDPEKAKRYKTRRGAVERAEWARHVESRGRDGVIMDRVLTYRIVVLRETVTQETTPGQWVVYAEEVAAKEAAKEEYKRNNPAAVIKLSDLRVLPNAVPDDRGMILR